MIPTVTEVVSSVVELLASVPRVVVDSSLDSELLPPPHAASAVMTASRAGESREAARPAPHADSERSTLSAEPAWNHPMCSFDIVCVVMTSSV